MTACTPCGDRLDMTAIAERLPDHDSNSHTGNVQAPKPMTPRSSSKGADRKPNYDIGLEPTTTWWSHNAMYIVVLLCLLFSTLLVCLHLYTCACELNANSINCQLLCTWLNYMFSTCVWPVYLMTISIWTSCWPVCTHLVHQITLLVSTQWPYDCYLNSHLYTK